MENVADDLSLQKDISSYSSFFKTQISLLDNTDISKNDKAVKGNNANESVGKITGDDEYKTEEKRDGVNFDIVAENISDVNHNSVDIVQNSAQKHSRNKNDSEASDKVNDLLDTNLSPIVRNMANDSREQTQFQNHTGAENKEFDFKREIHENGYNDEKSAENGRKENIHRENTQAHLDDKQQDNIIADATEDDHVEQAKENEQSKKQSLPVSEKLSKLNSSTLELPETGVLDTYESNSTKVANSPTNNLRTDDEIEIYDKLEDQMPEIKQEKIKKNILNEENSCKERAAMDEENLTEKKIKAVKQEDDRSNEINEHLMMDRETLRRETSELYSAESLKNSYKNKEEEKQDASYKHIETDENDLKVPEGKSDKDLDFENDLKRNNSSVENMYFTGRLPSLLSRNESLRLTSAKKDNGETNSRDPKEMENLECSHLSQESDKRNTFDEKSSTKSPHEIKKSAILGKGDVSLIGGKPLSPTRQIQELLQKINDTTDSDNTTSNIRPKSGNNRTSQLDMAFHCSPDPIMIVQGANELTNTSVNDGNRSPVKMTVDDINIVTSKVLGTIHSEENYSKFDNMPQIKQIDEYVQQIKKAEQEEQTNTSNYPNKSNEACVNDVLSKDIEGRSIESEKITNEYDFLSTNEQLQQPPSKKRSETDTIASEIQCENQQQFNPTSTENKRHDSQNVNSSSTENDLKAIIASAKVAISTGTETTESYFGFGTTETSGFTIKGDNVSQLKRGTATSRTTSKGMWTTTTQSDNQEALSSLICSNCLHTDTRIHLAGFCTNCQQYLCNTCISVHNTNLDTRKHEIVPSYCKNELAINKYVQATGFCTDCSMFLCMKCVVQHCGFRANRHHRIIQSSFVSKSSDRKIEANEFLDRLQDKLEPNTSEASVDSKKESKKKRKLLADLDKSNPYSSPFKHVPESLYPGPNKKVSPSYTKHPKWAHSSIPNLPYLVQPKPIPDRVFHTAGHHRPVVIYTKPKTGFDAMAAKFKSLKSKYKVKDLSKTGRRREQSLFTARPLKSRDGLSLPDIDSVKSYISGKRSIKPGIVQNTKTATKDIEFINEHCLSIPFPRGEKRTDVLAMTILMDGRLVILDKNNNNIKLFNKSFYCISALQFQNRLMDICASNLCPTDVYVATPKHIYEVSAIKGMDISRKLKVEIKRIEGIVSWKYGVAVISKKTNITWELRLLDYRGNLKSKLEVFNPFTLDIASSTLHHMTSSRGGKFVSISDTKNSCIITIDVTTRVVVHETMLEEGKHPTYLTSDGDGNHNLYVSCDNKIFQISKKGKVVGVLIDKAKENGEIGCIIYNKINNRMYIKTGKDMISEYQIYF